MRVMSLRVLVITVTVILFVATVLCVALAAFADVKFGLPASTDKTTVINTVVAVGAFVLVAWGVVVALAAYVSATGSPDLTVVVAFKNSAPNNPVFEAAQKDSSHNIPRTYIKPDARLEASVTITNKSKYSARNPGVRISFQGLGGIREQDGWETLDYVPSLENRDLQWDGGADYIIHGHWSRTLPTLNLRGMYIYEQYGAIHVNFAADGFGPVFMLLIVRVMNEADYLVYQQRQHDAAMAYIRPAQERLYRKEKRAGKKDHQG